MVSRDRAPRESLESRERLVRIMLEPFGAFGRAKLDAGYALQENSCKVPAVRVVVVVLLLAIAGSAYGQRQYLPAFFTGNDLLDECEGTRDQREICLGYVEGVSDALGYGDRIFDLPSVCVPPHAVPASQVRDIVLAYVREHPVTRHFAAAPLVTAALGQAFPCR